MRCSRCCSGCSLCAFLFSCASVFASVCSWFCLTVLLGDITGGVESSPVALRSRFVTTAEELPRDFIYCRELRPSEVAREFVESHVDAKDWSIKAVRLKRAA